MQVIRVRVNNFFKLLILRISQRIRQILHQEIIHVIGDSHTLSFQSSKLIVHYIGAVTAFNLIKEKSTSGGREKLFKVIETLKEGDKALLVFGEIDARVHAFNQYMKRKKKVPLNKIINKVIKNYEQVIKEIAGKKIKILIYNIVPPGNQGNIYNYPFYADWKIRLHITKNMNIMLADMCKKNGWHFIDIFNQTVNKKEISEKKFRREEFVFDEVHLNDKVTNLVLEKVGL